MRAALAAPLLAGCLFGEEIVELELEMPEPPLAMQYAPGCTMAVEVWLTTGRASS